MSLLSASRWSPFPQPPPRPSLLPSASCSDDGHELSVQEDGATVVRARERGRGRSGRRNARDEEVGAVKRNGGSRANVGVSRCDGR